MTKDRAINFSVPKRPLLQNAFFCLLWAIGTALSIRIPTGLWSVYRFHFIDLMLLCIAISTITQGLILAGRSRSFITWIPITLLAMFAAIPVIGALVSIAIRLPLSWFKSFPYIFPLIFGIFWGCGQSYVLRRYPRHKAMTGFTALACCFAGSYPLFLLMHATVCKLCIPLPPRLMLPAINDGGVILGSIQGIGLFYVLSREKR